MKLSKRYRLIHLKTVLYMETQKDIRDEFKISRLKNNIRENTKLLSELGLG